MAKSSKILFIIGTDTEVGKTYLTSELLRDLLSRGLNVHALKPVETDCEPGSEPVDAGNILKVINEHKSSPLGIETVNFYSFLGAVTPSVAARAAGVSVDLDSLAKRISAASESVDLLLVEGAGGLLSPVGDDFSFLELAKRLNADLLLVAASKLGVLNHAMLSMQVLKQNKLNLLGYLLNELSPLQDSQKLARESNPTELAQISREIAGTFGNLGLLSYSDGCNSEDNNKEIIAGLADRLIDYYLIDS